MPPRKIKPAAKTATNAPFSIQKAFEALCQHLREARKHNDGLIYFPEAAKGLREALRAHRRNDTSIEEKFVTELVGLLEYEDRDICDRLDGVTFTVIVEAILQTDNCQASQRGLYLLAASLHQDKPELHPEIQRQFIKQRKQDIGKLCVTLLFDRFADIDGSFELRRWIGILGLQLLKGNSENISCIEIGPDRIRQGLGKMLTVEANEIVRCLAGKVINVLREAGLALQTLWPANAAEEMYENFPQSSHDGWSQQFQTYLDDVMEGREPEEAARLYFAIDCYVRYGSKPPQQLSCLGHSLNVTLDAEFLTVHVPSSEDWPDEILEVPVPSISALMLRGKSETQGGSAAVYFVRGQNTALCTLNGKKEEVISIRFRGPPDMVQTMAEDFENTSPFGEDLYNEVGASDYDTSDEDTDSHRSSIKKGIKIAFSQEAMPLGSEIGSDESPNQGGTEQPAAPFTDDEDLYDASPKKTHTTQSPDELDHTRESQDAKKKDNPNIETKAVASQSKTQGHMGVSKKGPLPSKSKPQAQAQAQAQNHTKFQAHTQGHAQDQAQDQDQDQDQAEADAEEPVAVPKAKPGTASKPKIGTKAKVFSQSKKLDGAGKRTSQARSQAQAEAEEPVAVPKAKAAKPKQKTGKAGSQSKQPDDEIGKNTSRSKKQARTEVGEPAAASKANPTLKSKSKTGTQRKVASQSKKLDDGFGKRTSRSNPRIQPELEEAATATRTKLAAKSKPHTDSQSKADSQFNKAWVLAKADKKISQSESQTTTGRKKLEPKSKAKEPIKLSSQSQQPKSQRKTEAKRMSDLSESALSAESPDSEPFQISDEHNASTPKPSQAVNNMNKTIKASYAYAEQTQAQKGKMTSRLPVTSKGNITGDEYDLPAASDDEGLARSSNQKQKKSSRVKKGSTRYGKARGKNVLPQKMELFQDEASSKAKQARPGRPKKSATTKSSQLSSEDEIDDLQGPPPREKLPRKSQEAKELKNPPKVSRASKIPVPRGKAEKVPIRKAELPVEVEDEREEMTPAPVKRKARRTIIESDGGDYGELPMAGLEDDDNVVGVSLPLPSQVQNPDVRKDPVSLNQSQPNSTEKSDQSTSKRHPKEMADKMSQMLSDALVEVVVQNPPKPGSQVDDVDMEMGQELLHDPMDVLDDQNDLGQTPAVQVRSDNVSPVESAMGSRGSNASRKRKAEIGEPTPAKKRRSFIQEDVQNVSSQQKADAQTNNADGSANKRASEHHFKKPAVPRKSEAKKVNPFLETRANSVGVNEASFNKNLDTSAASERGGSVAAAGEENSNAPLIDDSAHRKTTLIAFSKSGPMNSGRLSVTPKSQVEAVLVSSSVKENQPAKKRKLDSVELVDVGSPPNKRQQSSPAQREDEGMIDGNFGDVGDFDNGLAGGSSPPPMSPAAASKFPRKRHSSQLSRVDANGSPLPLGGAAIVDNMGIDGRIKEHRDTPVVQGPFKANELFGTKAKIGSQNKARPESPENVELRYIAHQKTKSGNYEGLVGKEVVEVQQLADPFTEPHTHKSSVFTERLRSESSGQVKSRGATEQSQSVPKPQAVLTGNSFGSSGVDGRAQSMADTQRSEVVNKDTRKKIEIIQSTLPGTKEHDAKKALLVCGGGVDNAINALMASRAAKRSSRKQQVFTDDPEKTLVGGGMEVPGMSSGSSSEDSDPVRSPLQEMSSNETWNVAMRPHYTNLKDAVHRVADEMIIRLANEEDQMGLLVKQYQEGGAKIVDDLVEKRTQEKTKIAEGLMAKKTAMVKAYKASGKAIAKVVEATKNNPVAQFAEGWKARQAAIRDKIRKGKGAD